MWSKEPQLSFGEYERSFVKKPTRREMFLEKMDAGGRVDSPGAFQPVERLFPRCPQGPQMSRLDTPRWPGSHVDKFSR